MHFFYRENNSIYCMFDYLHFLWIATGLAPYKSTYDKSKKLCIYEPTRITTAQICIVIVNVTLYMIPFVMMLDYGIVVVGKGPRYEDYILTIFFSFLLYSSLISLISIHYKQVEIFRCLSEIHEVDKILRKLGINVSYTLIRRFNKSLMLLASISYMIFLMFHISAKKSISLIETVNSICFGLVLQPKMAACYYIIVLVSVTGVKFVNINQISFKLTKSNLRNTIDVAATLKKIGFLHFKLCGIANMVNKTFSYPLFAIISSVLSLINIATIFDMTNYKDKAVAMIFWTIVDLMCLFGILIACELTKHQANKTGKILCEINTAFFNNKIATEEMTILLQLLYRKVSFTAGYYINVGFSLIYAFANVLSMTVILMQNLRE